MRLSGTKANSTNQYRGLGDQLYDLGGARPTLDLNFANNESLVDSITGKNLVTYARASSATYVDGDGVIQTASTNTPRFDHDPATGESLGLLVEEARTNLLVRSKFNAGGNLADVTRTLTTEINPAGEAETRRLQCSAGSSTFRISYPSSSSNTVTVSTFVKKDTHRYVNIGYGGLTSSFSALFDIEPGLTSDRLLGQGINGGVSNTNISAGYQDYPNGWVRIWATGTTTGTTGYFLQLAPNETAFSLNTWTADGTEAIYVWGGQLEDDASFPTSLIHTDGSAVTRAADVTEITGNDFGTFNLLQYSEELDNAAYLKTNSQVTPNQAVAPDGTMTADFVSAVTTGTVRIAQAITVTTGVDYTASVYLKAGTETSCFWREDTHDSLSVTVDLSAGTINVSGGSGTITNVGNGWYRVTLTGSVSGTQWKPEIRLLSASGGIYAWGWQLEESSTATPYVKSDVTWTSRASNATYYDYTGTLRKSSYNNIVYSEEFDQTGSGKWSTHPSIASFGSGSVANAITAPNGTLTADKIVAISGTTTPRLFQSASGSGEWTFSVYAKAAEADCVFVSIYTGSTYKHLYYDLTNESVISATASSYSAVNVGNGWFRVSVTETSTSPYGNISFGLANATLANAGAYFLGNGADGIYLWGAQLETGPYAGDYAKTEGSAASSARDVAFLPDGNGNFVSAGPLLLEEARTNYILYSETILSNVVSGPNRTISDNSAVSPDGTTTAASVTATGSDPYVVVNTATGATAGTYTFSVYLKGAADNSSQTCKLRIQDAGTGLQTSGSFDITTEWQRYSFTVTTTGNLQNIRMDIPDTAVSGDIVYVWGLQIEAGSYPTSYIPTFGATATRAADVSSSSSNTLGNSFYKQSEGTFYSAWKTSGSSDNAVFIVSANSINNYIFKWIDGAGDLRFRVRTEDSNIYNIATSVSSNTSNQSTLAYAVDNFASVLNGGTVLSDSSGALPTSLDTLHIGQYFSGTLVINGTINRLTFWPQRLPNATLQTITT